MSKRTHKTPTYLISRENFTRCLTLVTDSGVGQMLQQLSDQYRSSGGRKPSGRRFSIIAVLVVALAIIRVSRVPSLREIHRMIGTLTPPQLAAVGMDPDQVGGGYDDYGAFHGWLNRLLVPLDPGWDLPARRITNAEHKAMLAARSPEDWDRAERADRYTHDAVNALIAASIEDKNPEKWQGDITVDGSLLDVAGQSDGLGSREDKHRAAAYSAKYYARDRADNSVQAGPGQAKLPSRTASGVEATVVSRIGPPHAPYSIPPVMTGVSIGPPSAASLPGFIRAAGYHQANGLDAKRGPRARIPFVAVDMAYTNLDGFNAAALNLGFAPVGRYPAKWKATLGSEGPGHVFRGVAAGPVQVSGAFYCPAIRKVLEQLGTDKFIPRTRNLVEQARAQDGDASAFAAEDARMALTHPYLMGTNSRPYWARTKTGRPVHGAPDQQGVNLRVRQDFVCPAVQGRLACPLKLGSTDAVDDPTIPLVEPDWPAERYRCCVNSQVTVEFSDEQWKRAQWGLVPGSWEHVIYLEAVRAATEQRFSILKSLHLAGFEHLKWAVRRTPMLYLIIGLWVAASNMSIQDVHAQKTALPPSTRRKYRALEKDLGHPPTRVPPLT